MRPVRGRPEKEGDRLPLMEPEIPARAILIPSRLRAPAATLFLTAVCLLIAPLEARSEEKAQARGRERTGESAGRRQVPTYRCEGFIAPLRDQMEVERGRTLPLKATLLDEKGVRVEANGLAVPPKIQLVLRPDTPQESDVTEEIEAGDFGKGLRFVFREAYWKFDLPTDELSTRGAYRVRLVSEDPKKYRVEPTCALRFLLR